MLKMSKVFLYCWLALEILFLIVLLWARYGLTTWDDTPQTIIASSPDAGYYISELTTIATVSFGVLQGLGLAAVLLILATFQWPRKFTPRCIEDVLKMTLLVIPGIVLVAVVKVGGIA